MIAKNIKNLVLFLVLAQTSFGQVFDRYNCKIDSYYQSFKETSDEYSLKKNGLKGNVKNVTIEELDSAIHHYSKRKLDYSKAGFLKLKKVYDLNYSKEVLLRTFNYLYSESALLTIEETEYYKDKIHERFVFTYDENGFLSHSEQTIGNPIYNHPYEIEYQFKKKSNSLEMKKNWQRHSDIRGRLEPHSTIIEFDSIGRVLKETAFDDSKIENRNYSYTPNSTHYSYSRGYYYSGRELVVDSLGRVTYSNTHYSGIDQSGNYTGVRQYKFEYNPEGLLSRVSKNEKSNDRFRKDHVDLIGRIDSNNKKKEDPFQDTENFSYVLDQSGNWIYLKVVDSSGQFLREVNRTITYYD
ncbi:MAG: hypothetical protein ACJA1C_001100 [Crocinitomicaceae bacterium]|jgi:hypothetical protein